MSKRKCSRICIEVEYLLVIKEKILIIFLIDKISKTMVFDIKLNNC
jgi:hypothetical protein